MRILKPGGVAVLTMPHSGLLGFMDPENWGVAAMIWVRAHLPGLYRRYKRLVGRDVDPDELRDTEHRHYSLADLTGMLDRALHAGSYRIDRVFRSGFVVEVLVSNLDYFLHRVLTKRMNEVTRRVFGQLLTLDGAIPYGPLANSLAVRIIKGAPVSPA